MLIFTLLKAMEEQKRKNLEAKPQRVLWDDGHCFRKGIKRGGIL